MDGEVAGIVTVTTMLYVEWGRLGEIGDLYLVPASRMKRIGRSLVEAAIHLCRSRRCSTVTVTITREGETRHRLSQFYTRFGFTPTDRISSALRFNPYGARLALSLRWPEIRHTTDCGKLGPTDLRRRHRPAEPGALDRTGPLGSPSAAAHRNEH